MNIRTLIAAIMFSITGSAFANHCPLDMKKIDEALARKPDLSDEKIAAVRKFRSDGEALHKAGKHSESIETLGKALKILRINN